MTKKTFVGVAIFLSLSVIAAIGSGAEPAVDDGPRDAFPSAVPGASEQTPEKIALGKKLYFDTRLSVNNKISCNSCHDPNKGGVDGKARSPGHAGKLGDRNAPTVLNAAYFSVQFWDGRAPTLEEQAKGPIINPVEMGMTDHAMALDRIAKVPGYQKEFAKVFGPGPVTIDRLVSAIAAYERTLVTPDSAYDKFLAGDKKALSASAQRGWKLVKSVGCTACHMGPMFNGPASMPVGQGFYQKFPTFPNAELEAKYHFSDDKGRAAFTKNAADEHLFRVPTWRNVALTAPYFHNGSVAKLDDAVRIMAKTQLNKDLDDGQVGDIVAFLKSLNGKLPRQTAPKLPQ